MALLQSTGLPKGWLLCESVDTFLAISRCYLWGPKPCVVLQKGMSSRVTGSQNQLWFTGSEANSRFFFFLQRQTWSFSQEGRSSTAMLLATKTGCFSQEVWRSPAISQASLTSFFFFFFCRKSGHLQAFLWQMKRPYLSVNVFPRLNRLAVWSIKCKTRNVTWNQSPYKCAKINSSNIQIVGDSLNSWQVIDLS